MWGLKHEKAECYSLIVTCFNLKMHPFVLASATGKASEERSFSRGWGMSIKYGHENLLVRWGNTVEGMF